jgi:multiple sugar transport system substrate-binding protein
MRSDAPLRAGRRAVVLLVVVLVAAACTSGSKGPSNGTELVWAIGAIEADPDGPAQAVADLWNDIHPNGPRVRVEALPDSADEQRQLMAIELNAGLQGLDILSLDVVWTGEFAESGWLVDLEDVRKEIEEVSLRAPVQSATWKGRLWAAPFTSGAGILYYRKDLVPTPPKTWEGLVRVGMEAAGRAGIEPFVGQGAQYEGMVVNFLEYFWAAGGEIFDADGGEVRFEPEAAEPAIEFMRSAREGDFYADGFSSMTEQDALEEFREGNAVFMRNWPYAYPSVVAEDSELTDKQVGIAALPVFEGHGPASALGGQNLAVSRYARDVGAAKEFVKFASTDRRVQQELLGGKFSRAPTMASAYPGLVHGSPERPSLPVATDGQPSANDPVMPLLAEVLPHAKPRPPTPNWASISDEIQQQVYPAYTRDRPAPKDAVKAIRDFLELSLRER